jgi:hypothetical protein
MEKTMDRNAAKTRYFTALKIAKRHPVGTELRMAALRMALRNYRYWKYGK